MFERYTEQARRVIFFARYEASSFGSSYIEVEHLLLGLMREDKALFGDLESHLLLELGDSIRNQQEQREKISTSVDLPLSHPAKRVLAYSAEEAERLAHKQIGTAHLLLGILREESRARTTLEQYGLNSARVREQMARARADPTALVDALRQRFAPLAMRLAPEVEPAVIFFPAPEKAE
ncbi:MAG TPA: Clp protease N-terminal domain-containing protein [Bryobacteraceae bacterium]|jgi:ATP-dependent Clp protease ATP-binding subunit ClpC